MDDQNFSVVPSKTEIIFVVIYDITLRFYTYTWEEVFIDISIQQTTNCTRALYRIG